MSETSAGTTAGRGGICTEIIHFHRTKQYYRCNNPFYSSANFSRQAVRKRARK
jgi:hypothetical protein